MHISWFLGRLFPNRLQSYYFFFIYANKFQKICVFTNIFVPLHPKMNETLSKIWHSPSARNVGKLLSANVIAQAIGLLVYPVLTRIYTQEDFGLLNLFLSIGGVLTLLSTSEYHNAILLPKSEEEAAAVARVALRLLGCWLVMIAITIPIALPLTKIFEVPTLACYYWLLVPYVAVMGGWAIYNAWLTRKRAFGQISAYQVNQSTMGVFTKLLFGWVGWLHSGLIVSSVLSPFIALFTSIIRRWDLFCAFWRPYSEKYISVAKRYSRFPLYTMPRSLVNNLSGNLPAILLTPYFGLQEMGFFALAQTLAFRPITMVAASIHQVLFEKVAKNVREGEPVRIWLLKKWGLLVAFVLPIMILLTCVMPWLVRVLLGSGWEETSTIIRYMMPWLTCIFLVSPFAFLSEVFGKQKLFLIIEILYLGLRIAAMIIGIAFHNFSLAIILMSMAGTVMLLVQLGCYDHLLRVHDRTCLS